MATTQYIGARLVPLFAEPLDWNSDTVYESLTIVYYAGNSYTSRQAVPKGIDITNEKYWALTGNYNAQIEEYRKEVKAMDGRVTENAQKIADEVTRAVAQEAAIKSLIEAEVTRAKAAENNNSDAIKTNTNAIAAEVTRAKNAEAEITTDYETAVSTEKTRATNAENELATGVANAVAAVNTEKERAEAAEGELSTKIDDLKLAAGFIEPEYLGRFAYPHVDRSAQGACIHNGTLVSVCPHTSDNTAYVYSTDIENKTNTVTTKSNVTGLQHAQSLVSDGSKIYNIPLYYTDSSDLHVLMKTVQVLNPSNYAIERTFDLDIYPYNISYDDATSKYYIMENSDSHDIYELNINTGSVTKLFTPEGIEGMLIQTFCVHDDVFYIGMYTPNMILTYNNLGELQLVTQLPAVIGFHDAQELESINYYNGDIICTFNGYQTNAITGFNVAAKVNVEKGNLFITNDNPDAYASRIRVYATASSDLNTKFLMDGSSNNPYPSMQEAAMAHFYNPYSYIVYASGVFTDGIYCSQSGVKIAVQSSAYSNRATIKNVNVESDIHLNNMIVDGNGADNAVISYSGHIYCYNTDISNATNGIHGYRGNIVTLIGTSTITVSGSKIVMSEAGIVNVPSSFAASDVSWTQSGKILTAAS